MFKIVLISVLTTILLVLIVVVILNDNKIRAMKNPSTTEGF